MNLVYKWTHIYCIYIYLQCAGGRRVCLGAARLALLQLWTLSPSTQGELAHPPGAGALPPAGVVGVIAFLGTGRPLGPLSHIAVSGNDAGLEGDGQHLLRTHAARKQRHTTAQL